MKRAGLDDVLGAVDLPQIVAVDLLLLLAVWADGAHQALGHDRLDRRRHKKRFDAHVDQPRERTRGIVRVQRAENQVTRQRGPDGDVRRLAITNLTHHDHVRILPQDVPQAGGKRQPDIRAHSDLVDALQLVLDRFLDGDDPLVHGVDRAEEGVKRGGLAGAGRPGHQNDPVRFDDEFAQDGLVLGVEAQLVETHENGAAGQQTQRHALAVNGRHGGDTDVELLALDADVDSAVLREAFLGDVHAGHDLDARDERRLIALQLRRHRRLVQNAVHAVADAELVLRRLEVNIRRPILERLPDDLVDELDHAGVLIALGYFLVLVEENIERILLVVLEFLKRLGADAVKFLKRLLDFAARGQSQLDHAAGVELHGIDHRRVERVADRHLERAVLGVDRQDEMLESHLGGHPLSRLSGWADILQVNKSQAHRLGQALEKSILGQPFFPGNKSQQRLLRAVFGSHTPLLRQVQKLNGGGQIGVSQYLFNRCKCHSAGSK